MRAVNLYYLAGISNERLFSDYENILSARNGVTRIRRADQTALRSLLKVLKKNGLTELLLYDGFFFSFGLFPSPMFLPTGSFTPWTGRTG